MPLAVSYLGDVKFIDDLRSIRFLNLFVVFFSGSGELPLES